MHTFPNMRVCVSFCPRETCFCGRFQSNARYPISECRSSRSASSDDYVGSGPSKVPGDAGVLAAEGKD